MQKNDADDDKLRKHMRMISLKLDDQKRVAAVSNELKRALYNQF